MPLVRQDAICGPFCAVVHDHEISPVPAALLMKQADGVTDLVDGAAGVTIGAEVDDLSAFLHANRRRALVGHWPDDELNPVACGRGDHETQRRLVRPLPHRPDHTRVPGQPAVLDVNNPVRPALSQCRYAGGGAGFLPARLFLIRRKTDISLEYRLPINHLILQLDNARRGLEEPLAALAGTARECLFVAAWRTEGFPGRAGTGAGLEGRAFGCHAHR